MSFSFSPPTGSTCSNRRWLPAPDASTRPSRSASPTVGCRRRLLDLYLRSVDHDDNGFDEIVARTEGTTASFFKELCRRAVLEAAEARTDGDIGAVQLTRTHLAAALDDLLDHSPPVLRSSLGAHPHLAESVEFEPSAHPAPGTVSGWVAFGPWTAAITAST